MAEIKVFSGAYDPSMKMADMHVHSSNSDGIWSIRKYLREAERQGLSGIAFTDHDDVSSGYDAREIAAREGFDIEVMPGVEVSTKGGHMLAYFPKDARVDDIPIGLSIPKTADIILARGGMVGFPHPDYKSTDSVNFQDILSLAKEGIYPLVELYNAGVEDWQWWTRKKGYPNSNETTREQYDENREILGARIAGTDAHFRTVGRGRITYTGSLESSLQTGNTGVVFIAQWERIAPWDPITHQVRLHRMERRREERFRPTVAEQFGFSAAD